MLTCLEAFSYCCLTLGILGLICGLSQLLAGACASFKADGRSPATRDS